MKNENKNIFVLTMFVVVFVGVLIFFINSGIRTDRDRPRRVSLIVYGNDPSRWENLRQGAELSCKENNAELIFESMSSEGTWQEQINLINREIESGADALLIAACDSDRIGEYINENKIRVPIVFVENGVNVKGKMECVTADDYEMGKALGRELIERENPIVKVAIISDESQRESLKLREKGLREIVEPYANQVVTWERKDNEQSMLTRKFLQRAMLEEAVDVVVALDNNIADALMDALDNLNRTTKVYAISTSDKSVYYLDQRKIKALEYQAEFSIGYIGADKVLNRRKLANILKSSKDYSNNDIKYSVVSKDNMYEYENQILIFPFVRQ